MSPEDFLSDVWEHITIRGETLPLPANWRLKVVVIPATTDDWVFAAGKAVEMTERQWNPVKPSGVFDYAVGILWNRIAERTEIDCRPLKPYVVDPAAAMQADADALAAQIEVEEEAARLRTEREERWARAQSARRAQAQANIDEAARRTDLVRKPLHDDPEATQPKIHISGKCHYSIGLSGYTLRPTEDDSSNLCGVCFPVPTARRLTVVEGLE